MKILVIGGTRYFGIHMVNKLLEQDFKWGTERESKRNRKKELKENRFRKMWKNCRRKDCLSEKALIGMVFGQL